MMMMFVLQEGAQGVIHSGKMQIFWGFRFGSPPLVLVLAPTQERPLSTHGSSGTSLQARQDHVGKVLLEPLEILPGKAKKKKGMDEDKDL